MPSSLHFILDQPFSSWSIKIFSTLQNRFQKTAQQNVEKIYVHMNVYVVIVIKLIKNQFIEQLFDWIWILTILINQYIDTNKSTILRWLGGQQMSHQICLKPCHVIFLAINYYLVKKTLQNFSIFTIYLYRTLHLKEVKKEPRPSSTLKQMLFGVDVHNDIFFSILKFLSRKWLIIGYNP